MATMRPVLTDFSMGEVSPKLAGRVDLPLGSKACKEMTNALPWELGGAGKRGGLEFAAFVDTTSGACRTIPWSISDSLDFLLVLFNRKIKVLNVSGGATPSFVRNSDDTADLEITNMGGSSVLVYDSTAIPQVRYAQSLNQIYMVHPDYPPFYMEYTGSSDGSFLQFENGTMSFVGNLAVGGSPLSADQIDGNMTQASMLDWLDDSVAGAGTTTINASTADLFDVSIKVGETTYTITDIVVTREVDVRRIKYYDAWGMYLGTAVDGDTVSWLSNKADIGTRLKRVIVESIGEMWKQKGALITDDSKYAPGNTSATVLMNTCDTNSFRYENKYTIVATNKGINAYSECGWFSYHRAYDKTTLAFKVSGGATVLTFSTGATGSNYGHMVIRGIGHRQGHDVVIHGADGPLNEMITKTTQWMIPGKIYKCDPNYVLDGKVPRTAVRIDSGASGPVLSVNFTNGQTTEYKRNTNVAISGEIAVNLVPFNEVNEYPSCVAFHQGRLCFGGSRSDPNVIYMSKVGEYSNFSFFEEVEYIQTALRPVNEWPDDDTPSYETNINVNQQIGASSAIVMQIATDENETIQTLAAQDDLFIGSATSEWIFPSGTTALNPRVVLVSRNGSAPIQSRFIGDSIMFVNPSRTRIRSFGTPGEDLLKYAEHIAKSKIVSFDFRQDPYTEIYAVLENGEAIVGRFGDAGLAWARIRTSAGSSFESVAAIRASDEDAVYFIVQRLIGSTTYRTIERLVTVDPSTFTGRLHLDCSSRTTTGGNTLTVSMFASTSATIRLLLPDGTEAEGVAEFNSSGIASTYTPTGETAPVAIPTFDDAMVGYPFVMTLETFRMDSAETEGLPKKADAVHFRMYESGRFYLARRAVGSYHPEELYEVMMPVIDGEEQYPYSGPVRFENVSPWDVDQTLIMKSSSSASFGVLAVVPQYDVSETI